jgi:protein-S-isoprenylcysteine O-methyltransferase Ste14
MTINFPLKIPPLLLTGLLALLMKLIDTALPIYGFHGFDSTPFSLALLLISILLIIGGVLAFRRASTTINPSQPHNTSTLVTTGVYRLTRNPMYVGFILALTAWGIHLGNPISFLLVVSFYYYMNCFQIKLEEKALQEIFGDNYVQYCTKGKRWL